MAYQSQKIKKRRASLLGNKIDAYIQAGRYGQTNGISQGSVLMDFIAELVLGYVDGQINLELGQSTDFRILRYRDDYRIFANNDNRTEEIIKIVVETIQKEKQGEKRCIEKSAVWDINVY